MTKLEWLLAWRYLRAKRREGFISVVAWFSLLGIMLGVATLIVVMSVMNGFRSELLGRIIGIQGQLTINSYRGRLDLGTLDLSRVQGLINESMLAPVVEGQALANGAIGSAGVIVRGMRLQDMRQRPLIAKNLPSFLRKSDASLSHDQVLIGSRLAHRLGLSQGDQLRLIAPQAKATIFGSAPRLRSFMIVGLFDFGMYEYDEGLVLMDLSAAQSFYDYGQDVTSLEINGVKPDAAPALAMKLIPLLTTDLVVNSWQQRNASFFTALQVERNVMFIILTMIIIVAAFNIISSQIMLVRDKARGIAILRSMGATRASILRIFLITGSMVGIIGAVSGLGLGLWIAHNIEIIRQIVQSLVGVNLFAAEIYFLSHLPSEVDLHEVSLVVLIAFSLSLLAAIYPAWRAASTDPVENLRYG